MSVCIMLAIIAFFAGVVVRPLFDDAYEAVRARIYKAPTPSLPIAWVDHLAELNKPAVLRRSKVIDV